MFADFPAGSVLAAEQVRYPYRDCHAFALPANAAQSGPICAERLILGFLAAIPDWADRLMRLRDRLAGPLGLKTAPPVRHAPPFVCGQTLGVFTVHWLADNQVLLGQDDRHLDFRLLLWVDGGRLHHITGVRPHHGLGWLYLLAVLPFHTLIVRASVRRMARGLLAQAGQA